MIPVYWLLVVANGVAVGTVAAGWLAVPIVSLVAAVAAPRGSRPLMAIPAGALLGWGALLARSARAEGFDRLTAAVSGLIPIPLVGLVAATLVFPFLLALGATLIGGLVRRSPALEQEESRP